MPTYLDTLSEAIQDTGYWCWWAAEYPDTFQLEFGGVQLYTPPQQPDQPPSSLLALRFTNPISVSFITHKNAPAKRTQDWPDQLHNGSIDPPTISYGAFTFNDAELITEMLSTSKYIDTRFGPAPTTEEPPTGKIILAFQAGPIGLIVSSHDLTVLNFQGEIKPKEIEQKHNDWWAYWQEYWRLKDTPNPLPTDYACEVTIPLAE